MTRRSVARERVEMLGGRFQHHVSNAGRSGTLGLDECTEAQRMLRVQLALSLFDDPHQGPRMRPCLHPIFAYNFNFVPGYEGMTIWSDTPDDIAQRLIFGADHSVAGIRFYRGYDRGFDVIHLPTGAKISFATPGGNWIRADRFNDDREPYANVLDPVEAKGVAYAESIDEDSKTLLAGIIARLTAFVPSVVETGRRDKQSGAYGHLFNYTPGRASGGNSQPRLRSLSLTRHSDSWLLRGPKNHQFERIAAILSSRYGIAGCEAEWNDAALTLRYRSATLVVMDDA